MDKVVCAKELMGFVIDKAFSDNHLISDCEYIKWLKGNFEDFFKERGETFDFSNERLDSLNTRIETLMSIKETGDEIFEKLNAILDERIKTGWGDINVKLGTFGVEGLLTNTGVVMPLRSELSNKTILSTQKTLMKWKLNTVSFNEVDEAIQTLKNDLQETVDEFDKNIAINA